MNNIKSILKNIKGKINCPESDFEIEVDDLGLYPKCPECKKDIEIITSAWFHDHDVIQVLEGLKEIVRSKKGKNKSVINRIDYVIDWILRTYFNM